MKGIKSKAILIFISVCLSGLLSANSARGGAWEQLQGISGGGPVNIPPVGDPQCVSGCEDTSSGGSGSSGGGNWINNWQERERQKDEQRKAEAYNLNEQGNKAYNQKNWTAAIELYKKALRKSPDDKVIRQNLKNAEAEVAKIEQEKKREDELRREQAEYRKEAEKLTALMPVVRSMPQSDPGLSGHARSKVPLPGFSAAQWKDYLEAQDLVNSLYAKLNREGALSDADSKAFYSALNRRNELWANAVDRRLASAERDRLRLPLPVIVNKSLMDLAILMVNLQPGSAGNTPKPKAGQTAGSPDRRIMSNSDKNSSQADAITNTFVADFFSDKITKISEIEVGKSIENVHGEKMKDRYENLLGLGRVAVKALEGGRPEAGAETADLIISKIPEPFVSARAEHAVEGGRMYSNVAYRALNRFMEDAMKVTGSRFNSEGFWTRFNESLTEAQKGIKKWIQFGE